MTALGSIALVVAALAFVAWPLLRPALPADDGEGASLSPLERQKHEAYAAIKEAEFDLRMGKLSETDFAEQTDRYRRQALSAITALETAAGRRGRAAAGKPAHFAFCPACGGRLAARVNFCGQCGQAMGDFAA